jgi:hypothetical protein
VRFLLPLAEPVTLLASRYVRRSTHLKLRRVINKTDLAPLVGASLEIMAADAFRMRVERPFVFSNLKSGEGVGRVASFVIEKGGLAIPAA